MSRRHVNENLRTAFRGSGRLAGIGINEDDYSEEAYPNRNPWWRKRTVFFVIPDWAPGPVTVYKLSEEELKKYRGESDETSKLGCIPGK